jgi:hypothetical protein
MQQAELTQLLKHWQDHQRQSLVPFCFTHYTNKKGEMFPAEAIQVDAVAMGSLPLVPVDGHCGDDEDSNMEDHVVKRTRRAKTKQTTSNEGRISSTKLSNNFG